MKRLLLALVCTGLPSISTAADKPLPVTVTNSVVPVEVSNADPVVTNESVTPSSNVLAKQIGVTFFGSSIEDDISLDRAGVLKAVWVQVSANGGAGGSQCRGAVSLSSQAGVNDLAILATFGLWPGRDTAFSVPLPNIAFAAGSKILIFAFQDVGGCKYGIGVNGVYTD